MIRDNTLPLYNVCPSVCFQCHYKL